jgi:MarR family transcriptional regulator, organic hydroperoxide resistance regulator
MKLSLASRVLMDCYPRIFFACHRRHVRDTVTRQVLSSHQASILDHLDDVEPTSMTALALHMGVTASTMSLAIDRLQSRGYVVRERDRTDARKVQLRLTRHGVRLKESQSVLDPAVVRSMLKRLTPGKREKALHGLALLAAAATEEMHQRGADKPWRRRRQALSSPRTRGEAG